MKIEEFAIKYPNTSAPKFSIAKEDITWRNRETDEITFRILKGSSVSVRFLSVSYNSVAIQYGNEVKIIPAMNAAKKLTGFTKEPSIKTMEKWMDNGIALTVTGKRTEPDGIGEDGSPSWMLVLGLI